MKAKFEQHKAQYLIFFFYSLLSLILFLGFKQSSQKFIVLALYAAFYFSWAIIVHIIENTFTLKNLLENFLISTLGLLTLKVLFFPNL